VAKAPVYSSPRFFAIIHELECNGGPVRE